MDHFRQLCEKLIYLFGLFGDRHTSVATLRTIFKASSAKKWYSETSKKIRCPKRILYIYIYVHYILYMYMIHNVSIYLYVSIYKCVRRYVKIITFALFLAILLYIADKIQALVGEPSDRSLLIDSRSNLSICWVHSLF